MERPNKEDYDFNDVFEGVRFASNMIKYADYLEAKQLPIHVVSQQRELLKVFIEWYNKEFLNYDQLPDHIIGMFIKRTFNCG